MDKPELKLSNNAQRKAIVLIRQGQWEAAHLLVRDSADKLSCLIHAYLHREEGDNANAAYWYRRAGEKFPGNSLDEELTRIENLG